jgi:hypothetical protein
MQRTLESLRDEIVQGYEVLDFKSGESFYFLRIKAEIIDGSELYVREYVSREESLYSYHWQNEDGSLRVRWDNSPHHKGLRTFPHHKHVPELEESEEVSLEDVIAAIKERLAQ